MQKGKLHRVILSTWPPRGCDTPVGSCDKTTRHHHPKPITSCVGVVRKALKAHCSPEEEEEEEPCPTRGNPFGCSPRKPSHSAADAVVGVSVSTAQSADFVGGPGITLVDWSAVSVAVSADCAPVDMSLLLFDCPAPEALWLGNFPDVSGPSSSDPGASSGS